MKLSQRMQNVVESQTIAMTKKARELKSKGHDVISLSIGEPDFDTPEVICQAANSHGKWRNPLSSCFRNS
jgi:aspartate aminotransferase